MPTDPAKLLDKIRLGEDSFLELKDIRLTGKRVSAPHADSLADELAAFANTQGGRCVLGVADKNAAIPGIPVEHLETVETFVQAICTQRINPPLAPIIERLSLPTEDSHSVAVLSIQVPRSLFVHQSPGGYVHRVGSSKRVMPLDYLARLFQQRSQVRLIRFDEQTVPTATLDDLSPTLWQRFRSGRSQDTRDDLLIKLAMARSDDDGQTRPTVAGVLMASPDPRRWLPKAFIQATAYRGADILVGGDDQPYQLDARDITGPLDQQVLEACRFVQRNMRIFAYKHMGRRDLPQFDMTAVFEALVNAVAHRDYAISSSKIRLRLFSDRLELYSPGALPNTMTLDSLPYRQAVRNEAITSLLSRCTLSEDYDWLGTDRQTLMDKRGEGVAIILSRSEQLSGQRPDYQLLDDAELRLTLFSASVA